MPSLETFYGHRHGWGVQYVGITPFAIFHQLHKYSGNTLFSGEGIRSSPGERRFERTKGDIYGLKRRSNNLRRGNVGEVSTIYVLGPSFLQNYHGQNVNFRQVDLAPLGDSTPPSRILF